MAIFRVGSAELDYQIIGAGLRNAEPPPSSRKQGWDLDSGEMRDLEAFEAASWRFHPQPEIDWGEAKHMHGEDIEAGLLARHPRGGLVIFANHLVTRLGPGYDDLDPDLGKATRLPVGTDLFDVRLNVPDSGLLARIQFMIAVLTQAHGFDGAFFAEPLLYYHVVNPGTVFHVKADPEAQWQWEAISLEAAWKKAGSWGTRADGSRARVAIIDLGFYIDDAQIAPNVTDVAFVDASGNVGLKTVDAHGTISYKDTSGNLIASEIPKKPHGTICAGLVGAILNRDQVNGVVPECELMLVAVESVTTTVAVTAAIEFCVNGISGVAGISDIRGADVISGSIAPDAGWDLPSELSDAIDNAGKGRGGLGTLIAWASSNKEEIIVTKSLQGYDPVLCASRCNRRDERVTSGHGSALDLIAPGVLVVVVDPEIYSGVGTASGSSCAAPIVAGVAALVLCVNNGLKSDAVATIVTRSCDPELKKKVRDDDQGWGRVNALRAIKMTPLPP